MSMASFGLVLLALIAVLVIATGLPAYVVLLLTAVIGACTGLAAGVVTLDLLGALPGRLFNLLENDLLIERFFIRHPDGISLSHADGLTALMDLGDNDLLDLLLRRKEPSGEIDTAAVHKVLAELRT